VGSAPRTPKSRAADPATMRNNPSKKRK
jgi:hypothetical protein